MADAWWRSPSYSTAGRAYQSTSAITLHFGSLSVISYVVVVAISSSSLLTNLQSEEEVQHLDRLSTTGWPLPRPRNECPGGDRGVDSPSHSSRDTLVQKHKGSIFKRKPCRIRSALTATRPSSWLESWFDGCLSPRLARWVFCRMYARLVFHWCSMHAFMKMMEVACPEEQSAFLRDHH